MRQPEIFQEVIQRFYQQKDIEDEMLFYILDDMSERFVESRDDIEWQCYDWILEKLNKIWQYKKFDQISAEQSYLYGGIWGSLSMLSYIKKKKTQSQTSHVLAAKYENDSALVFLKSIYNNPGLQNKKLAELCDVSPARISQIASNAIKDGLISTQIFGKEKCYYIRTMGECVCDIIQRHKDKLDSIKEIDYKAIYFSNDENNFFAKYRQLSLELEKLSQHNKVVVAVAIARKQEDVGSFDRYEINGERKNILWEQAMSNSNGNFMNLWKAQREVAMINRR